MDTQACAQYAVACHGIGVHASVLGGGGIVLFDKVGEYLQDRTVKTFIEILILLLDGLGIGE